MAVMDGGGTISFVDVCVIICAWNAEDTIVRAVASALKQREVREVVVVDDCSSDDTAGRARGCDDGSGRLTVERFERNAGPSAARNRALAVSKSPLICILDADDYMQPGRLTRMFSHGFDDWDFLADDLLVCEEGGDEAQANRMLEGTTHPEYIDFNTFIRENIGNRGVRNQLGYLKPVIKRRLLDEIGLRYNPELRLGEDYILYATAIARGARFKLIEACGYVAVHSKSSLSSVHSVTDLQALHRADRQLMQLGGLTPTETKSIKVHGRFLSWKISHRLCLQAKKQARYFSVLGHIFSNPTALPHMVAVTWKSLR